MKRNIIHTLSSMYYNSKAVRRFYFVVSVLLHMYFIDTMSQKSEMILLR